ncbi:MAG: hypothetical protein N3B16_12230, partial [Candidatus Aminicenantes bacterium]|nr:hypothetical protein [Candidatus Aminicenantes bacterium]
MLSKKLRIKLKQFKLSTSSLKALSTKRQPLARKCSCLSFFKDINVGLINSWAFLFLIFLIIALLSAIPDSMAAQLTPNQEQTQTSRPAAKPSSPPQPQTAIATEKPLSVIKNQITINGRLIPYTATAGEITILKPDEKPGASIFFVAYTRDDVKDKSTRPIMFCFNGGPGSSTVWLHLGGLGPKKVALTEEGYPLKIPADVIDSEDSLLDVTDLVFVDAVSTGYSRPLPGEDRSQFHGVEEDANAFTEFIRIYLTKFDRWLSPKFLLGESYGTCLLY